MGRNETQQLPNTDPTSFESNNWPNQNWNSIDWGSVDYYNWGVPMVFWGKPFRDARERKTKRVEHSVGWASSQTPTPDPAVEAYSRSEWD